jgi:hypothetical protein
LSYYRHRHSRSRGRDGGRIIGGGGIRDRNETRLSPTDRKETGFGRSNEAHKRETFSQSSEGVRQEDVASRAKMLRGVLVRKKERRRRSKYRQGRGKDQFEREEMSQRQRHGVDRGTHSTTDRPREDLAPKHCQAATVAHQTTWRAFLIKGRSVKESYRRGRMVEKGGGGFLNHVIITHGQR